MLRILDHTDMMEDDPHGKLSMEIRGGYLEPLHYLQIELLDKIRKEGSSEYNDTATLEMTMMVTITGVAIALRNTG